MNNATMRLIFYRPTPFPPSPRAAGVVLDGGACGLSVARRLSHEGEFDLNELLITNSPATFLVRVSGESMDEADICHGDLLIVDKSVEAKVGHIRS